MSEGTVAKLAVTAISYPIPAAALSDPMSPQNDIAGPVPDTLIPKLQFCNNTISISSISVKNGHKIPSGTHINSFAPEQEHYFFDLDEENLVLQTGFEPVCQPRKG